VKVKNIQIMRGQRGIVLIVAMLVMAILSVLALAFLSTALTEDTIAVNYRNHTAAFYAAEAGLESGVSSLKRLLGATPTPTDAQLTALAPAALTDPSYTFDAFQVQRVRATPPFAYTTTLSGGAYNGLFAQTTDYVVTASVTGPRGSRAQLGQTLRHLGIPLFQFAAFYGRGVDLEIYNSPVMNISGRIHANSNIYMMTGDGLQIDSYVTTTGTINRGTKARPGETRGNPEIKDASGTYQALNFDHFRDYDFSNPWAESAWRDAALTTFGGQVQDSAMGVQEIIPPIPDAFYDPNNADKSSHLMIEKGSGADPPELKDAKLYYQADLLIVDDKAYDQVGKSVDINTCKDAKGKKAVRKETFYDAREKMDMQVTQIDVGALTDCGVMPKNGILYASPKPGSPNKGDAVRLVNGEKLPSQGLSVVSDTPVYVQGDYNTVNKVPAAVMADAVTVLSNNWGKNDYDKKGKDDRYDRPASPTTVNAAFATGPSHESEPGKENGQLNNLIRFLEVWTDVDFTYNGSLVALWHSQVATAEFRMNEYDTYFKPPNRIWGYDPLFNTNPPPGTPMGIIITRGQWSEG
jgi:Tfp pilus assembly protein PilX